MISCTRYLLASAICLAIGASGANAYTYHYRGKHYQGAQDPYTSSMRISADIVVRKAIPPNYQGEVKVKSFKTFDGVYKIRSSDSSESIQFYVETDGSGLITGWNLQVAGQSPDGRDIGQSSENDQGFVGDTACWAFRNGCDTLAYNTDAPGDWTAGGK